MTASDFIPLPEKLIVLQRASAALIKMRWKNCMCLE